MIYILTVFLIIFMVLSFHLWVLEQNQQRVIEDLENKSSKFDELKMLGVFDYTLSLDLCNGYRSIKDYFNQNDVDVSSINMLVLGRIYENESVASIKYYCYRTNSTIIEYHYDIDQLLDQVLDNLRQL